VDKRRVKIAARNQQGLSIEKAWVTVDGKKVGETPLEIELPFSRAVKTSDWPVFNVRVEIPDEYKPVEKVVALGTVSDQLFELTPVTEMAVTKYFPQVEMTPRGPRISVDLTQTIGTAVDDRDEGTAAESVIKITNFERKSGGSLQALNSFTITPDGQSIVYGVTYETEEGRHYSNLHLRSTNPSSPTTVQLTRGPRFLDSNPTMCREAESKLVVFQSNRGRVENMDISSFRIADGRLVGGIQQLTRESRFNYRPSFASDEQPLFFSSLESFPEAEPRMASVRKDGSAFTNHGEVADMINCSEAGRIYLARLAKDTGRFQLFSVLADGTGSETFLSDSEFSVANCHSPAVSPDGKRLLFVSDYNPDDAGRKDNNIWLMEIGGTRQPVQLTNNISDDIFPVWSPTEPDVVYFMSNRRGVYNVWRLTFRLAH
jgi:Tol biopolymer transport system component